MRSDDAQSRLNEGIVAGLRGNAAQRRRAVDELYKQYSGRIRHYMARRTTPARAEELLHEVFIRVLRHSATFKADAQRFEVWLWRIARNVRIDHLRAPDFDSEEAMEEPADPDSNPEVLAETDALRRCVAEAYQQFERRFPDRALALSWLATDHLSIREIATALERSEGATREYLSQCRKKLEPFLEVCRGFLAP